MNFKKLMRLLSELEQQAGITNPSQFLFIRLSTLCSIVGIEFRIRDELDSTLLKIKQRLDGSYRNVAND